jgi:2-polyprenyl-3-methyl-5-hydroxy-6-metoxy-1,4-benzoquinol methylase
VSDQRYIESPPAGLEGWREVWRDDLRQRPEENVSLLHRLARAVFGPLIRPSLRAAEERQRNFNIATLELITDLRNDVADLQREVQRLQEQLPIGVRRNDALISALDQKIETLASRVRDLTVPALQEQAPSFRDDFVYRRLEDSFRGDVREEMRDYVALAKEHAPALDVGCGRGEFLEQCRDAGVTARGMDSNERSIADLRSRGLDAELGLVPQDLSRHGAGAFGSILASHVVEHLPANALIEFFAQSARILKGGGVLMIETPDADSFKAANFWRDPTHIAPRPAAALIVLGREFGFEPAETRGGENLRLVLRKA